MASTTQNRGVNEAHKEPTFGAVDKAASGKLVKDGVDSNEMRFAVFLFLNHKAGTKHKGKQGHRVGVFQEPTSMKCRPKCR